MNTLPYSRFLLCYFALACIMVATKFAEQASTSPDAYSLFSNLLGLALLLPWIVVFPGGRLGVGINTPEWFFILSALNLGLLLVAAFIVRGIRRGRDGKA